MDGSLGSGIGRSIRKDPGKRLQDSKYKGPEVAMHVRHGDKALWRRSSEDFREQNTL